MSTPVIALEVVAGLLLLAGLVLIFLVVRRWSLQSGHTLVLCAIRGEAGQRWRLGMLRFGGPVLGWFSIAGPSSRAVIEWQRRELDITAPLELTEQVPGLFEQSVTVVVMRAPVAHGPGLPRPHGPAGEQRQLAMSPAAYLAMRSWLESSPPGPWARVS